MKRGEALAHLQELPGIGPFSAELFLPRRVGYPDAFPCEEPGLRRAIALAMLERIADNRRPYRS